MKTIAALILAVLLAVMAYGIFWLVCLNYTMDQMKDAVREALGAEMSYGTAQWVPDPLHVTMDLPNVKLVMGNGPVREVRAAELQVVTSFLMRDRWQVVLPKRVEVVMANGTTLMLETDKGEVMWRRDGGQLTLRAEKLRLLDLSGNDVTQLGDLVLDRRQSDTNVRVNLASRPKVEGGEAVLSGHITMPAKAFSNVLKLFGSERMPGAGEILGSIAHDLQRGGNLELDNVSFKYPNHGASGAVYGKIHVLADGRTVGNLTVTADSAARAYDWVQTANLLDPRNEQEVRGMARFSNGLEKVRGTIRMDNMQDTLMLNGQPVGPLPMLTDVVARLWN